MSTKKVTFPAEGEVFVPLSDSFEYDGGTSFDADIDFVAGDKLLLEDAITGDILLETAAPGPGSILTG